jgi:hypothetical protein
MKASIDQSGNGLSRIRLNWQGDSRQNGRVSVPAAVFGASFRKGFPQ